MPNPECVNPAITRSRIVTEIYIPGYSRDLGISGSRYRERTVVLEGIDPECEGAINAILRGKEPSRKLDRLVVCR